MGCDTSIPLYYKCTPQRRLNETDTVPDAVEEPSDTTVEYCVVPVNISVYYTCIVT